jgi:hypothetical protein
LQLFVLEKVLIAVFKEKKRFLKLIASIFPEIFQSDLQKSLQWEALWHGKLTKGRYYLPKCLYNNLEAILSYQQIPKCKVNHALGKWYSCRMISLYQSWHSKAIS